MSSYFTVNFVIILVTVSVVNCAVTWQTRCFTKLNTCVTWMNNGTHTQFKVNALLKSGINPENAWLGVGLNQAYQMLNTTPVICRSSTSNPTINKVTHNINSLFNSQPIDTNNVALGLSDWSIMVLNGNLTCQYTRINLYSAQKYQQISGNSNFYMTIAYGSGNANKNSTNFRFFNL